MVPGVVSENGYRHCAMASYQLVGGWWVVTADNKPTPTPASLCCDPVPVPDEIESRPSPDDGQDDWNIEQYLRSVLIQMNTDYFSLSMETVQQL